VAIDARVLMFTVAVSLVAPLVFGLAPASRASRVDPNAMLRAGGLGTTGGGRHHLRRPLVAAECALALVVLIGTGLLLRSYARITSADPGFMPNGVLSLRISLPGARYKSPDAVSSFYDELSRRVMVLPGVESVGSNYQLPLSSVALAWEPVIVDG